MSEEKKAAATRYHRKTLLDAADRLIMQYGYDGMNMNMLSKEAGYSKATIYVYFESKDEIVRLLCIERLKLLRREFSVILKNGADTAERLEEIRSVLDEFASDDRAYFDFICASAYCDPDAENVNDSQKELSSLVCGILDDLTELAPERELKSRWYAYYGKVKTSKLFGN